MIVLGKQQELTVNQGRVVIEIINNTDTRMCIHASIGDEFQISQSEHDFISGT